MSQITRIVLPSQEYLVSRFRYEPETGFLFWHPKEIMRPRATNWNSRYSGTRAFTSLCRGYLFGSLDGQKMYAHRVIWKILHGTDPEYIDHVNSDRKDNRPENLRSVTARQNQRNMKLFSRNKSGVVGVSFSKTESRWAATICGDAGPIMLGKFKTFDEAVACRKQAEIRYGYHEMHGLK